ncbi:Rab-GTPase-TBC domain [Pseudocohnilembus persalinus]|uniref:Rab-GTPase-TBC domain n=1 Tax=Pseudocohnilembus persalinus TaxID=266149 RepID=A0A0V0QQV4_PSEPJ|nr:Rab-GTPase-TBC domain [Pseudocohnilembus persalinus]|eukprot:KRX04675.1 Rab-GTPase-TBC domain [Pseudocohnilembus persalinus]
MKSGQQKGKSKTSYLKDHPLSKKKDSQWNTYFEDKKLLDKILKDTLRTRTTEDFFTQKVGQYKEIKQQQQENLHETGQLKQQKNNQEDEQYTKANSTNDQKKRNFFSRFIKPKLPGKINQDNGQNDDFNSSLKNQNQQNKEEIKISKQQDDNKNNHINNNIQNENKDFYHYEVITRILFIYAKLNPQVDYTQGMNEICAIIYHCFYHDASNLFRQYAESDTFFCFCIFMTQIKDNFKQEDDDFWIQQEQLLKSENVIKHQKFMNQNIRQNILIFEEQFKKCDYILYNHMEQEKVDSKLYVVKWIMVLLGQEFHIEEILRLWDSIMIAPEKITFTIYLCLAVLYIQRDELLQSDFSQIIQKLQDISTLNIDKILEFAIKLYRQYNCQNDIFKYEKQNTDIFCNNGGGDILGNLQQYKQNQQDKFNENNESKTIQMAMVNKRDVFRTQIRKKQNENKFLQKRQILNENSEQSKILNSITQILPKYLSKNQQKLEKYMSDICKHLKNLMYYINKYKNINPLEEFQNFYQNQNQSISYYNDKELNSSTLSQQELSSNSIESQNMNDNNNNYKQKKPIEERSENELYQDVLNALKQLEKIIYCQEEYPIIYLINQENIQEILFHLIHFEGQQSIQKLTCCILGNIVQKDKYIWQKLVENNDNLCDILICCFKSEWCYIQALPGLGNICLDYPQIIDRFLHLKCEQYIKIYLEKNLDQFDIYNKNERVNQQSILKVQFQIEKNIDHLLWLLNIIISQSRDNYELQNQFLPFIDKIIGQDTLTPFNINLIKKCLDCLKMMTLNSSNQTIQNVMGDDDVILQLINIGFLDVIVIIFQRNSEQLRIEVSFALRNILATSNNLIHQKICEMPQLLSHFYNALESDSQRVKKQLYYALSNFFQQGDIRLLCNNFLTEHDFLGSMLQSLDIQDTNCLVHFLQGFQSILEKAENIVNGQNPIQCDLDQKGFDKQLEGLQEHPDQEVFNLTQQIIEKYYQFLD